MFLGQLFEAAGKQVKVIYPGRFQPFHKGHAQVYQHLCEKFGKDNVYIVTSDKVEMPKSPFSFAEKKAMIGLTGIDTSRVIQDTQPYRAPGLVAQFEAANTILLFAISEKDMAEDPRFQFKPKKDGSPSYFQQFTDLKQCRTLDKHGYMMTVPTFNFTVLGKPANSASQIREQFAGADLATQRKIVTDLFGKFDNNVFNIMKARLEGTTEVAEDDDSDIVDNLVKTTGRTHEEAQRILRAARRRAMLAGEKNKASGGALTVPAWGNTIAQQIAAQPRGKEVFMKGESVEEANNLVGLAKTAVDRQTRDSLKKADNTPFEAHGIYGLQRKPWRKKFKNVKQMETWCDRYDAEVHGTRDLESAKRGSLSPAFTKESTTQVTELHVDTHASHVEKRSPQIIPTLMKDTRKGAKMARAVSKSMAKVQAFNKKTDEPNVFTEETNSAEMARRGAKLKSLGDQLKKDPSNQRIRAMIDAEKLEIRKLKGEMELRARDKVEEGWKSNLAGAALAASMAFGGAGAAHAASDQDTASYTQQAGIDYTKTGPITYDSMGQKLEYGVPVDAKGNFQRPNDNLPNNEYKQQLESYYAWQTDYKKRWPNGGPKPIGPITKTVAGDQDPNAVQGQQAYTKQPGPNGRREGGFLKVQAEAIVPGFGEMHPEQVQKEVEGLTAEMLQYARDGNMRAVAEYIKKLQPFVDTARKGEITESIDKALRTAKRNAV